MARWHTGIAPRPSGLTGTGTFAKIGPLVSIGREPPQNSTDNPINDGPVLMRYSIRSIKREHVKDYLPQNPWIDHISSPMNDGAVDLEGISAFLNEEEFQVLIIEDYNATGIIGDPYQHRPGFADASGSEYDVSTKANTFYWFSRALAIPKPKSGRGGSWGLGKLAAPLASAARTFFCVTKQFDSNDRYLFGQAVVNQHQRHGELYENEMFFAEEDLQLEGSLFSWSPINNENQIGEFCRVFGVDRETAGTSLVIPFPKEHEYGSVNEISEIAKCIIANWTVPILDGLLEVEFVGEGIRETIRSDNLRQLLQGDSLSISWEGTPEKIGNKPNPAWSSKSRLRELVDLNDSKSKEERVTLEVKTPSTERGFARSPNSQIGELIPQDEETQFINARDAFHRGEFIHVSGSIPVWDKDNRNEIGLGNYTLILHKSDIDSAEAHFYRDQISLPLVRKKESVWPGVSSLLEVSGDQNPLAQMLRDSEGPAHLEWDPSEDKFRRKYLHGKATISFLRDLGNVISSRFNSVESEDESLWDDIFSIGGGGSSRQNERQEVLVDRNLRISELDNNGFSMVARANAPDLTGNEYILRIGYPKPAKKFPKTAPDKRSINIHRMSWLVQGAELEEFLADDGAICFDRYRIVITESDFLIEMTGLDPRLKAQVIAQLEAEELVE